MGVRSQKVFTEAMTAAVQSTGKDVKSFLEKIRATAGNIIAIISCWKNDDEQPLDLAYGSQLFDNKTQTSWMLGEEDDPR